MRSGLSGLLRKAATITALSALAAGGVIALATTPAAATARGSNIVLPPTSWSYVDSAAPDTSFVGANGNAPVGTQVDATGLSHTTKSYYTYDISQFRGDDILSGHISAQEESVANCAATTTPQAWVTAPAGEHSTWRHQPAQLSQLGSFTSGYACPTANVNWSVATEVQHALDEGRSSITIEFTLPDDQLTNPDDWRGYNPAAELILNYDRAPVKPTQLMVGNTACAGKPFYVGRFTPATGLVMSAVDSDPDSGEYGTAQFVFWPKGHPDQRTEIDAASNLNGIRDYVSATTAQISDNTDYILQVRATDTTTTGPWSTPCEFITDLTPPQPPTVSSPDYGQTAAGGSGIPGTFVFDSTGNTSVVGFYYELNGGKYTYVAADHDGGTATIRYAPPQVGPYTMTVWSVDKAGDYSPQVNYRFLVANNSPAVSCTPASAYLGVARQCTFSPRGEGTVTGFVYSFNNGPSTTIAAGPDGTATVTVTPTHPNAQQSLSVFSQLSNGNLTASGTNLVATDDGLPTVTPNGATGFTGVPIPLTLTAVLPDSVSFTYEDTNDGIAPVTVPVGPDGTATVTFTPPSAGFYQLNVFTKTASGIQSGATWVNLNIATNGPTVTSDDYPQYISSGGVSVPGTFDFSSPLPGVVSYTYTLNDAAPVTVPTGSDGTASTRITPLATNETLLVSSTFGDGTVSAQTEYDFYPNSEAPKVACNGPAPAGQPVNCTFTAVQPGAVSFTYSWNGGPDTSLAVAADGTGTVTLIMPPAEPGGSDQVPLVVTSVNNLGVSSDPDSTTVYF